MINFIVALILFILLCVALRRAFKPNIELVFIELNSYKILLWYNSYEGYEVKRKWVKLYERKKR